MSNLWSASEQFKSTNLMINWQKSPKLQPENIIDGSAEAAGLGLFKVEYFLDAGVWTDLQEHVGKRGRTRGPQVVDKAGGITRAHI